MKNLKIFCSLTLLLAMALSGCKLFDPDEPVATIVEIQPFDVYDSIATPSYAKPTTAFVYFNNKNLGAYTLPARVPVIAETTGELRIVAGVTKNGTSAYQEPYLPYYNYVMQLQPQPGKIVSIAPVTGFRGNINPILFTESFESSNQFIYLSGDTIFKVQQVSDCSYCGTGTGVLTLEANKRKGEIISSTFFNKSPKTFFLELNYRNTVDFEVGLTMVDNASTVREYYMVGFKPKSEWNKVYIPLNETMNLYTGDQKVFILFKTSLPDGLAGGKVELDNIRVLAF